MQDWTMVLPTALSLSLHVAQIAALARVRDKARESPPCTSAPLVSILKPLAGDDDELEANLESFLNLDYPNYELIFGIASLSDSALPVIRRILEHHPDANARLVITDRNAALNPKVAQLEGLVPHARGSVLVISDSNVHVESWYLRDGVGRLQEDNVAMVTHLFAGSGERTLGAALENLQINNVVSPGVATLAQVGPRPLTIGKSMFVWKRDIDAIGGFLVIGNYLAEDHALGGLLLARGRRVVVSPRAVANRNTTCSITRTFERHLRWAKMRRSISSAGFFIEPVLSPIVVATFAILLSPSLCTFASLVVACGAQVTSAAFATEMLRKKSIPFRFLWLELLRPWLIFACWALAWFSRTVVWRGNELTVGPNTLILNTKKASRPIFATSLRKRTP